MNTYRLAGEDDLQGVRSLFLKVRESIDNSKLFNWSPEMIETELINSQFYVSLSTDQVIEAFISFRENADSIEILALGTAPDRLRSGTMKGLLKGFAEKFSKNGKGIYLEVHPLNKAAISLYDKCGFKLSRVRKSYYKDGSDGLEMSYF